MVADRSGDHERGSGLAIIDRPASTPQPCARPGRERLGHGLRRPDRAGHARRNGRHRSTSPATARGTSSPGRTETLVHRARGQRLLLSARSPPPACSARSTRPATRATSSASPSGPTGRSGSPRRSANDIGRMTLDGAILGGRGPDGRRPARVHRPGPGQHALVHREGREPDRPDHRHRSAARRRRPRLRRSTDLTRPTSRDSGLRARRSSASAGSALSSGGRSPRAARSTIRFERRARGRFRRVRRKMSFQSTAGAHRLRFRGRFDLRHPLRPGRYRMTLRVRDAAGNVSTPDRVRFTLLPRRQRR